MPEPAKVCVSCHGENGVGITSQYPTLAGQHADYIVRALQEYKQGGRKNPIMMGIAATVKDEDMASSRTTSQAAAVARDREPALHQLRPRGHRQVSR